MGNLSYVQSVMLQKNTAAAETYTQSIFTLILHRSHTSLFKYKLSLKELEERENILHLVPSLKTSTIIK